MERNLPTNAQKRIEMLKAMQQEEPHEPFHAYAIALEHRVLGAQALIEALKQVHHAYGNYIPAIQMLAQTLADEEQLEQAVELLEKGMHLANEAGNVKAHDEMAKLYYNLSMEL